MAALRFAHNLADIPARVVGAHVVFDRKAAWDTPERGDVVKVDGRYHRIAAVETTVDGKCYDLTVKEVHEPVSW